MWMSSVFEVLAEPRRRQILDLVRGGELSVNELVARLQMNQPAVSKHLRVLREAGLVGDDEVAVVIGGHAAAIEPGSLRRAAIDDRRVGEGARLGRQMVGLYVDLPQHAIGDVQGTGERDGAWLRAHRRGSEAEGHVRGGARPADAANRGRDLPRRRRLGGRLRHIHPDLSITLRHH